jgi:tetratricopeptide (TPR) repeat protein
LTLTGAGLWQFYTSGVNAFPEDIRNDLRKALYYQNYGNDRDKAVGYYRSALNAAMQHPDLKVDGPEVTGIMIQLGTMFQDMGRTQEAIDVLVMAFEVLVHGRTMGTGNDSAVRNAHQEGSLGGGLDNSEHNVSQENDQTSSEHVHGPRVMDGPTRLKTVGIAQKLGDLYHALKKDQQAERYYLWSVEQLMKNHEQIQARSPTHTSDEERLQNARDREAMRKQFSFDNLPSWMTKTDFGASLEALGGFYTSKGVYSYVLYCTSMSRPVCLCQTN